MRKVVFILILLPFLAKSQNYEVSAELSWTFGGIPLLLYSVDGGPFRELHSTSLEYPSRNPTSLAIRSIDDASGDCQRITTINFTGSGCRTYTRLVNTVCYDLRIDVELDPHYNILASPVICYDEDGPLYGTTRSTAGFSHYDWQYAVETQSNWLPHFQEGNNVRMRIDDFTGLHYGETLYLRSRVPGCDWTYTPGTVFRPQPPVVSGTSSSPECYGGVGSFTASAPSRDQFEVRNRFNVVTSQETFYYMLYRSINEPAFASGIDESTNFDDLPTTVQTITRAYGNTSTVTFDNLAPNNLDPNTNDSYWLLVFPALSGESTIATGCGIVDFYEFNITQPAELTATEMSSSSPNCRGGNASIVLDIDNGVSDFTYRLNSSTGTEITPHSASSREPNFSLDVDDYPAILSDFTIHVVDENGCWDLTPTISGFTNPNDLTISSVTTGVVACPTSTTTAAVTLGSSPSNGSIVYSIDELSGNISGASDGSFSGIPVGSYTARATHVVSSSNCDVATRSFSITAPDPLSVTAVVEENGSGCHVNDVRVTAATGGHGEYDFQLEYYNGSGWSVDVAFASALNRSVPFEFSNRPMNRVYRVVVRDNDHTLCPTAESDGLGMYTAVSVNAPEVLENPAGCDTGAISVTGTGGSSRYDYQLEYFVSGTNWDVAVPYSSASDRGSPYTFPAQTLGRTYRVRARDHNNTSCSSSYSSGVATYTSVGVNTPEVLETSGCDNGSIRVTGTGGSPRYDYQLEYFVSGTNWDVAVPFSSASDQGSPYTFPVQTLGRTYRVRARNHHDVSCLSSYSDGVATYTSVGVNTPEVLETSGCDNGSIRVAGTGGSSRYDYQLEYFVSGTNWDVAVPFSSASDQGSPYTFPVQTLGRTYRVRARNHHDVSCLSSYSDGVATYTSVGVDPLQVLETNGCDNGLIRVTGTGGSSRYDYQLEYFVSGTNWDVAVPYSSASDQGSPYTFPVQTLGRTYRVRARNHHDVSCLSSYSAGVATYTSVGVDPLEVLESDGCDNGLIRVTGTGGSSRYDYQLEYFVSGTTWDVAVPYSSASDQGSPYTFPAQALGRTYRAMARNHNDNTCHSTYSDEVALYTAVVLSNAEAISNVDCHTGEIEATASGGSGTYDYRLEFFDGSGWSIAVNYGAASNQGNSFTFPAQVLGRTYQVSVRDHNRDMCESTFSPSIDLITNVSITQVESTPIDCFGASNGSITITAIGGAGTKMYSLSGPSAEAPQPSGYFDGLLAGEYTITVYDINSCTRTTTETVGGPDEGLSLSEPADIVPVSCFDGADGSITVHVTGGTTGYQYSLSGTTPSGPVSRALQSDAVFMDLSFGTYDITVVDAVGCTISENGLLVNEPPTSVALDLVTETDILCHGASTGSIEVDVSGGTVIDDYTYRLSAPGLLIEQGDNIFTNLPADTYEVTVIDDNLCSASQTMIELQEPPTSVAISETMITDALCNGESNGLISVDAGGGTGTLSYTLSGTVSRASQENNQFENLPNGTYSVTVADENGCSVSQGGLEVGEPAVLAISDIEVSDVPCFGGEDGEISISVVGGTTAYQYSIDGTTFQSSSTFSVAEGNYTVTVVDLNGCQTTAPVYVGEPVAALTFTSSQVSSDYNGFDVSCFGGNDGAISIAASGGTGDIDYSIFRQNAGGTYDVQHDVPIENSPQAQLAIFNTNVSEGTYRIVAEDENGCTDTVELIVFEPAIIEATLTLTEVVCPGDFTGEVSVSASGGVGPYLYAIDGGTPQPSNSFTGLAAGTYTITISDGNSCSIDVDGQILEPPGIQFNGITIDDTQCNGSLDGSVAFSASGGTAPYQYFVRPFGAISYSDSSPSGITGDQAFAGLAAGDYILTIQDAPGCLEETTITIGEPDLIAAPIFQVQRNSCNAVGEASLTTTITGGTGPYNVEWRNSSNQLLLGENVASVSTITGLEAGTYSLIVSDSNGCTNHELGGYRQEYNVLEPSLLVLDNTVVDVTCFGFANGHVTLSASGGWQENPYTFSDDGVSFSVDNVFTGLDIGSHDFYVRDSYLGGYCEEVITVVVSQPDPLAIDETTIVDVACFGESNGSFDISMIGGTAPYEISLDNSTWSSLQQVTGLNQDTYSVWIRDVNECVVMTDVVVNQPDDLVLAMTNVVYTSCAVSEGSAEVLVTGGTLPYAFEWTNESGAIVSSTSTVSSLDVGIYSLQVTDGNGCVATDSLLLSSTDGPEITVLDTGDVTCLGGSDGFAVIEITGGTGPYQIRWLNSIADNRVVQELETGTYSVEITDDTGCRAFREIPIAYANLISFEIAHQDPLCFEDANGFVSVTSLGAQLDYEYLWNTGATASSIENLVAGTYHVDITYGIGCLLNYEVTLEEPDLLDLNVLDQRDPFCFEGNTGLVSVDAFGGTAPYSYQWAHDGSTTSSLADLYEGTYEVTVTDANGCVHIQSIALDDPDLLEVSVSLTSPTCNGLSDGSLGASAFGGTAPYSYQWQDEAGNPRGTTALLENVTQGSYQLTTIDANFCTRTDSYLLTEPAVLQLNSATVAHPLCQGDTNGSIQLVVEGGTLPYSYLWSDGSTGSLLGSKGSGSYSVTVTDQNGCSFDETFELVEPDLLELSTTITAMPSCFEAEDGSIRLDIIGGTSPYSGHILFENGHMIDWSDEASPYEIVGLSDGEYTISISDQNGCAESESGIVLTHPEELTITLVNETEPSCNGDSDGALEVLIQGGTAPYLYSWTNGANTSIIEALIADTYAVTVTDANGCELNAEYILSEPDVLTLSFANETPPSCNGFADGSITTAVTGGTGPYTYVWSNGSSDAHLSELAAGEYSLQVIDQFDCTVSLATELVEPAILSLNISLLEEPTCNGAGDGSIIVWANGGTSGYTYTWSNGQTGAEAQNLIAGTYTVVATDEHDCTVERTIDLMQPDPFSYSLSTTANISCFGGDEGEIELSVFGGVAPYSGELRSENTSNGAFSLQLEEIRTTLVVYDLLGGDYELVLLDANGCEFTTQTTTISQPEELQLNAVNIASPSCFEATDGELWMTATGGTAPYSYVWSNGQTGERNRDLGAGNYEVIVTDARGCELMESITLVEPALLTTTAILQDPSCSYTDDGSINLTIEGGTAPYTFAWSNGAVTEDLQGLISGDFTFQVFDNNGCSHTETYTLQAPDPLTVEVISETVPSCADVADGSFQISTSGGTGVKSIVWSNGQEGETISNILFGTYSATVTDVQGCELIFTHSLSAPIPVTVALVASVTPLCSGDLNGAISVVGQGGTGPYTYQWSNGERTSSIANLEQGTYEVTVTDNVACATTMRYELVQPNPLDASVVITQPSCMGEADAMIQINASGGTPEYVFTWDHGASGAQLQELGAGSYSVSIEDANGCIVRQEDLVIVDPTPTDVSISDFAICSGQIYLLEAPVEATEYRWTGPDDFESIESSIDVSLAGAYSLAIVDSNGCPAETAFNVVIDDELLQADFLVASEAFVGDTIFVIDISWPVPDEVTWDLPEAARIVTLNDEYLEIIFDEPGTYPLGVSCVLAGCNASYATSIKIRPEEEREADEVSFGDPVEALIKSLSASPNPTEGKFTIELKLSEERPATIKLVELSGNNIPYANRFEGSDEYKVSLDASNLTPGLYLIYAEAGKEQKTFRLLVR